MENEKLPAFEDTEELPSFDQTEELPSLEETEEIPMARPEDSAIPSELKGAGLGALIGSIPGITTELTGLGIEKAAKARSPYTPEQLALLSSEYDRLKTIDPVETMEKVGGEFYQKNRNINEIEKQAYSQLSEPVSEAEYRRAVALSTKPLTREIEPTTPKFLKAKEELTPSMQTINPIMKQEQDQLEKFAAKKLQKLLKTKDRLTLV